MVNEVILYNYETNSAFIYIQWYLKSINWISFAAKHTKHDTESCNSETSLM